MQGRRHAILGLEYDGFCGRRGEDWAVGVSAQGNLLHSGEPVTAGMKKTLRTDIICHG